VADAEGADLKPPLCGVLCLDIDPNAFDRCCGDAGYDDEIPWHDRGRAREGVRHTERGGVDRDGGSLGTGRGAPPSSGV